MRKTAVLPLILAALLTLATWPAEASETITELHASATSLSFTPRVDHAGLVLTVRGPHDVYLRYELGAGRTPTVNLHDQAGNPLPDGSYTWELRLLPVLDAGTRATLAAARQQDDSSVAQRLRDQGRLPQEPLVQSGSFAIAGGLLVAGEVEETAAASPPLRQGRTAGGPTNLAEATEISGNLTVHDSLCVGFDCANSESYGFDTIRLKENSLRIHFDDTSTSAGFPNHDWRVVVNDSASGGLNKFSIEDSTSATTPFTVEGSAPTNSLYVDDAGRVGLGTATPVLDLHIASSNTPALRLEQNGSGGFTAQTWDVAGNEASFFVRDVTSGSRLPLRIRPGAPSSSIDIAASGNVGIGTASPDAELDISHSGLPFGFRLSNSAVGGSFWDTKQSTSGYAISKDTNSAWLLIFDDGRVRLGPGGAGNESFLLATNGNLEIAGTLTENSNVHSKQDFQPVDGAEILAKLMELDVTSWAFKNQPEVRHIGPMAQDFHATFGLGDRADRLAGTDVRGVTLAAVQELNRRLQAKDAELEILRGRLAELDALQARLAALEELLARQP